MPGTAKQSASAILGQQALPQELWSLISSFLDVPDTIHLSTTCKDLRKSLFNTAFARKTLLNFSIVQIETSATIIYFLDSNGRVWWRSENPFSESLPQLIPDLKHIKSIATNNDNLVCLDAKGDVFVLGRNNHGELGLGVTKNILKPLVGLGDTAYAFKPTKAPMLQKIKQAVMSNTCSLFLDETGNVYGTGENKFGELGLGDYQQQKDPVSIPGLPKVAKILIDRNASFFMGEDGSVWQSGKLENADTVVLKPKRIPELHQIVDITSQNRWLLCRDIMGQVWVSDLGEDKLSPKKISNLYDISVIQYSASDWFFINSKGETWICNNIRDAHIDNLGPLSLSNLSNVKNVKKIFSAGFKSYLQDYDGIDWICPYNLSARIQSLQNDHIIVMDHTQNEKPFSQIKKYRDSAFDIIKIDNKANLSFENISKVTMPFNFMINHHINILEAGSFSLDRLLDLVNTGKAENECFYHAMLNVLKTQDSGTRLYYLNELASSQWKSLQDFAMILLAHPIHQPDNKNQIKIDIAQNDKIQLAKAFMSIYDYLKKSYAANSDDQRTRREDFFGMINKINTNQIMSIGELQASFNRNKEYFTHRNTLTLFGYEIKRPCFLRTYHHLREKLINALGKDLELFAYLKHLSRELCNYLNQLPEKNTGFEFEIKKLINNGPLANAMRVS